LDGPVAVQSRRLAEHHRADPLAPSLTSNGDRRAVGGVWLATLLPALLLARWPGARGPARPPYDHDRRDVIRALLFLSSPLFPNLTWIYAAKFLPAAPPVLDPRHERVRAQPGPADKLERANQLSLPSTYAPPVAAGYSVCWPCQQALGSVSPYFTTNSVDLALYFNAPPT